MFTEPTRAIKIFYCYARKDKRLRDELESHLAALKRSKQIVEWYDRDIQAGMEWEQEIEKHLNSADIVLLLVSPDFMASDYCYGVEMRRALERHSAGEAHIIPIILRPVDWKETPIGKLQALPADGKPVTVWRNRDNAFQNVVEGLREMIGKKLSPLQEETKEQTRDEEHVQVPTTPVVPVPQLAVLPPSSSKPQLPQSSDEAIISPTRRSKHIPRRAVVLSLAGLTMAGGSITWLLLTHKPPPQGTTLLIYRGHTDAVLAVAWSPDGQYIASGSADETVHVWDPWNGNRLFKYVSHSPYGGNVNTVAWSPDSKRVASGYAYYSGAVEVWNVGNQNYDSYEGHANSSGGVKAVAWSPDGKYIASGGGSGDGTVQVWNADNKKSIYTYPGHSKSTSSYNGVNTVAWSPNGTRIASGGDDKTVQIWDARDGGHLYRYPGHTDAVNTVAWSPDGTRIASGSTDKTVQVWDARDGGHSYTHLSYTDAVNTVAWSPDGTRIASGSDDKTVQVWNARDSNHVYIYQRHSDKVTALVWSPDGTHIASGSTDKTVQVWQAI